MVGNLVIVGTGWLYSLCSVCTVVVTFAAHSIGFEMKSIFDLPWAWGS